MGIIVDQVEKSFLLAGEKVKVIDKVSLSIEQGCCAALLGPSGCGKSTLLSLIAGFFPYDAGSISIEGKISLCLQNDMLLPWRDVLSNVCLPVEVTDKSALPAAREQAEEYLELFGLKGFGKSYPSQLSGGMSGRAALLRTLISGGDIWLLDEPFAKLDSLTKEELQIWLFEILKQFNPGIMLITHDIEEALRLADKIYLLSPRPMRVVAEIVTPKGKGIAADEITNYQLKQEIREMLRQHST